MVLIAGTAVGSLVLYDLNDFDSAALKGEDFLDYKQVIAMQNPAILDEGETNLKKAI